MPTAINDPIDPRLSGAELHVYSGTGSRLSEKLEIYRFQSSQLITPGDEQLFARVALTKFSFTHGMYNLTGDQCLVELQEDYFDENVSSQYGNTIAPPKGRVSFRLPEGYYTYTNLTNLVQQMLLEIFDGTPSYQFLFGTHPIYTADNQFLSYSDVPCNTKFTLTAYRGETSHSTYLYKLTLPENSEFWYSKLLFPSQPNTMTSPPQQGITYNAFQSTAEPNFLQPTRNIYVGMDAIPSQIVSTHEYQPNLIGRVPVLVDFGEKQSWQEIDPFYIEVRNPIIHSFVITLYDDDMNILTLNNKKFTLSLYFDYVKIIPPGHSLSNHDQLETPYVTMDVNPDRLLRRHDYLRHIEGSLP